MSTGIFTAPLTPNVPTPPPQPPPSTGKRLTDYERSAEAAQDSGSVTAANRVEPGAGGKPVVAACGSGQKRRRGRSPFYHLVVLLAKTYRQPGRLPTDQQASELERLLEESKELLAYRASHRNWREEEEWS
jgi:hypothetical protein